MRRASLAALGVLLLALLAVAPSASAKTHAIHVTKTTDDAPNGCTKSDCSLREAIIKSNSTSTVETIVLKADTYNLSIAGAGEDLAQTGDLDITRPVKIKGTAGVTTINQTAADRVFHVIDSTTGALTLKGVTVTGGHVTGDGGGIAVDAGRSLTLDTATVDANHASGGGGGISDAGGTLTITRSTVSTNVADAGSGGGGISASGPQTISITNSTISGNSAANSGGGIDVEQPDATFTLLNSTVSGNQSAYRGGGLIVVTNSDNPVTLDGSTISGNTTTGHAGGLLCLCGGGVPMSHVTITNNTADSDNNDAGVMYGGLEVQLSDMRVEASIIAGNHDVGQTDQDCGGEQGILSQGFNVFGNAGCAVTLLTSDRTVSDALFLGPLADNGGPTQTHAIIDQDSSPVDLQTGADCGGTDQRGVPRPDGSGCDSGSYERAFCGPFLVSIVGTNHSETIHGTSGNDGIIGLGGNDKIFGEGGFDGLCGGSGKDKLDGGDNIDDCYGGPGADRFANCEEKFQ